MEELQSEDLEELVQELEEDTGAEEVHSPEIEELRRALQSPKLYTARRRAAEQLGELDESNLQIVEALVAVGESDSFDGVKRAVVETLRAPVHQEILLRHPGLNKRAKSVARDVATARRREQQVFEAAERESYQGDRAMLFTDSSGFVWVDIAMAVFERLLDAVLALGAAIFRALSPDQRIGVVGGSLGTLVGTFAALSAWNRHGNTIVCLPVIVALVFGPLFGLLGGQGMNAAIRRLRPDLDLVGWVFGSFLPGLAAGLLFWGIVVSIGLPSPGL